MVFVYARKGQKGTSVSSLLTGKAEIFGRAKENPAATVQDQTSFGMSVSFFYR